MQRLKSQRSATLMLTIFEGLKNECWLDVNLQNLNTWPNVQPREQPGRRAALW